MRSPGPPSGRAGAKARNAGAEAAYLYVMCVGVRVCALVCVFVCVCARVRAPAADPDARATV